MVDWMLGVLIFFLLVDLWVTVRHVNRLEERVQTLEKAGEPEQVQP